MKALKSKLLLPIAISASAFAITFIPSLIQIPQSQAIVQWNQRFRFDWKQDYDQRISAPQNISPIDINPELKWTLNLFNVNKLYLNELNLTFTQSNLLNNQIGSYDSISSAPEQLRAPELNQSWHFKNEWTNSNSFQSQPLNIKPVANAQPIQFKSHFDRQQILKNITIDNHPKTGATIILNGLNLPPNQSDYQIEASLSNLDLGPNTSQPEITWSAQISPDQARFQVNRQVKNGAKIKLVANTNSHPDLEIDSNNLYPPGNFNYHNSGDPRVGQLMTTFDGQMNFKLDASQPKLVIFEKLNFKNHLDWKLFINDRYQYFYNAVFQSSNQASFDLPDLTERMQFLVNQVSQNAKWDNEFFFGPNAFNKALKEFKDFPITNDINLLFLTDDQKAKILTWYYQDVFKQVFKQPATPQANRKYNLINNHSAAGLQIYQPAIYDVQAQIQHDNVYLYLTWQDWDGKTKTVSTPIKTKFYLEPNEFMINPNIDTIDFNNFDSKSMLKFGDQFTNLDLNFNNSQLLYQNLFNYQDRTNNVHIFQSAMTYDVFSKSLFDTNIVNWQNLKRNVHFKSLSAGPDLALGRGQFEIILGDEIARFFLPINRPTLVKQRTFSFINFNHQYDLYYADLALNPNQPAPIILPNANDIGVNQVNIEWLIKNLILYDNRSYDQNQMQLLKPIARQPYLLATNLDQSNFLQLLQPQLKIIDRNLATGAITISLTLKNFNHQPSSTKLKQVHSPNGITYQLYDWKAAGLNQPENSQSFYFSLQGFQKNYDLNINQNRILDANVLQLTNPNQVDPNQLIAFSHQTNRDPLWPFKLLTTRLSQAEFKQLIKTNLQLLKASSWSGYGNYRLTLSGDSSAIFDHNHQAVPNSTFQPLTQLINDFTIINFKAQMEINTKTTHIKFSNQPNLPATINDWWKLLLTNSIFGFQNQNQAAIIKTNALDQNDFINSIKTQQVQISKIKILDYQTIQLGLIFNPHGGQVIINNQSQNQLDLTISGFNEQLLTPALILDAHNYHWSTINDLGSVDWQQLIDQLIDFKLIVIQAPNQSPFNLWTDVIDKKTLNIQALDPYGTTGLISLNLTKPMVVNEQLTNQLVLKVINLQPLANLKAKQTSINLNQALVIHDLNQDRIIDLLWTFKDQSPLNQQAVVFDNHLLTKSQFFDQVNLTSQIVSQSIDQVSISIDLERKYVLNSTIKIDQPQRQTYLITLTNFQSPPNYWNDWKKQTLTWSTVALITIAAVAISTILIKKRR